MAYTQTFCKSRLGLPVVMSMQESYVTAKADGNTYSYKAGEATVRSDSTQQLVLVSLPAPGISGNMINVWTPEAALQGGTMNYIPASGTPQNVTMGFTVNDSKALSLYFKSNGVWPGVRVNITPQVGDKFIIDNQTFTTNYQGVTTTMTLEYLSASWDGTNWNNLAKPAPLGAEVSYSGDNVLKVETHKDLTAANKYYAIWLYTPEDAIPYKQGWDQQKMYTADAATVIKKSTGEQIKRNVYFIKEFKNSYEILIADYTWTYGSKTFYEFETGDQYIVKGKFSKIVDGFEYIVNLDFEFTYNGVSFDTFIPKHITEANEALENLGDSFVDTPEYRELLADAKAKVSVLSNRERLSVSDALVTKMNKQYRDLQEADYTKASKTVITQTITTESIDATSTLATHYSGAVFNHCGIDIGGMIKPEWNANYRGNSDSYFENVKGEKTYESSAIVFNKDNQAIFIFVTWLEQEPRSTDYPVDTGDKYVVNQTGYFVEDTENNTVYRIEFEGKTFIYTGKYYGEGNPKSREGFWVNEEDGIKVPELVRKVNAIGTVELTDECKAKIDNARDYLNTFTEDEYNRVHVSVITKLETAEQQYADLVAAKEADAVVKKIDAIGTVELTEQSKAKIDAARTAYNDCSAAAKAKISADKLKVLTDAEARYQELVELDQANAVIVKIDAIGTVEYTAACKAKIDDARQAYNALSKSAQDRISAEKYQILLDAEAKYASLKAVDDFKTLVGTLNESSTLSQIYSVIIQAKVLYDKIDDKSAVAAEYAILQTYIQKYNDAVSNMNSEHKEDATRAMALIGATTVIATLLSVAVALMSKKGRI